MGESHVEVMIALALSGAGLLTAGLLTLALRGRAFAWRAGLTLVAAAAAAGVAFAWGGRELATITAGALAAVTVPYLLVTAPGASALIARLAHRPALTALALCAAGLVTTIGAFAWYDEEDQRRIDEDMVALSMVESHPPLFTPPDVQARTDRGTLITVKTPITPRPGHELLAQERGLLSSQSFSASAIRTSSAADTANCHGWVFTAGRYWIEGQKVDTILKENGYVAVTTPRAGDLVVYRDDSGISHTAVVRYVTDGQPVMVEGKWGSMGVYLHRVHGSLYGTNYTYYRSPRRSHVLAGLLPPSSESAAQINSVTPSP